MRKTTTGSRVFNIFNICFLILTAAVCLLPILNVLALSFSDNISIQQGKVAFWPVNFNLDSYKFLVGNTDFWRSMGVSVKRVALGYVVNMVMTILVAYPLSKSTQVFPARTAYAWFFLFTMLFGGGLVPGYLVVKYTGLLDSIWALVLPGAVPIFNVVLLLNFMRQLPKELEEAAYIDGAGHMRTLWNVILPVCLPSLATISLFVIVGHWNEWFSPIIYMQRTENYPLQTYLRSIIISTSFKVESLEDSKILNRLSNKSLVSAQIFLGMAPILCVYPFLQKYFAKGIVLGSVKG
jgi:putative aldouronate transport system permease protein